MSAMQSVPWNHENAAHLLARAGFGATPEQIDAAVARPLMAVVDDLLKPVPSATPPSWVKPGIEQKPDRKAQKSLSEEERRVKRKEERQLRKKQMLALSGWWCRRMVSSPSPLQEKMTLFWHGHFATSVQKVKVPYMMYLQNQTFREKGLGGWQELVTAVSQDPAMLVYLDNTRSKVGEPNENYARELMELFTLGEGHYSERDIKEAARAFTGWRVDRNTYTFRDMTKGESKVRWHDHGTKNFFGKQGNFDGHDIIRIILEQDQAARFISAKLWRFFAYDSPEPQLVEELARTFRTNDYSIAVLMKAIFMHPQFYSDRALRTQIKSPAQWLAGSCIALGMDAPDAGFCMKSLRVLGQELFAPPNVKGWDGGFAWITTSSLTGRYNLAGDLVEYRSRSSDRGNKKGPRAVDPQVILPESNRADVASARGYLERRIYPTGLTAEQRKKLDDFFESLPPVGEWSAAQIRNTVRAMMSTPLFQLT